MKTKRKKKKPGPKPGQKKSVIFKFIRKHSLSMVLVLIVALFKIAAGLLPQGYWYDFCQGFGDDAWGALLIVIATKYFIEKGSQESK